VRVGRSFRVTEDDVNEYLRKSFYNAGWSPSLRLDQRVMGVD